MQSDKLKSVNFLKLRNRIFAFLAHPIRKAASQQDYANLLLASLSCRFALPSISDPLCL